MIKVTAERRRRYGKQCGTAIEGRTFRRGMALPAGLGGVAIRRGGNCGFSKMELDQNEGSSKWNGSFNNRSLERINLFYLSKHILRKLGFCILIEKEQL